MVDNRDYDKILKRLDLVWKNEILDRPCLSVTAPKDPKNPYIQGWDMPKTNEERKKWYTDGEWILKRKLEQIDKTYYAGDALPMIFPYFGTGGHAKYIAPESSVEYTRDTIWIHPCIDDLESYDYSFDPETNKVFKLECEIMKYLVNESNGRYFVGMPDNCGSYDALSQLRGAEDLLVDFLTDAENVKYAGKKIVDILIRSGDVMFDILKKHTFGGSAHAWMNSVSKGKLMQLQCDVAAMLSKDIFDEFLKDELVDSANWLDNVIYHLDGMEQIRHLDTILSIDKIDMIQWVQVDGQPKVLEFIPELRRIQEAKKGLIIGVNPKQALGLLENLSPNGLNLLVQADSKEEADAFLKLATKYY